MEKVIILGEERVVPELSSVEVVKEELVKMGANKYLTGVEVEELAGYIYNEMQEDDREHTNLRGYASMLYTNESIRVVEEENIDNGYELVDYARKWLTEDELSEEAIGLSCMMIGIGMLTLGDVLGSLMMTLQHKELGDIVG